jgi:hypothetical protein
MRPPASPSCRLALRAGSHRGLRLRPGGNAKEKCGAGALSLLYKIDRIHSFDIRHSTVLRFSFLFIPSFDIRHSIFYGSTVLFFVYFFLRHSIFDIRYSTVLRFAVLYIPSFYLVLGVVAGFIPARKGYNVELVLKENRGKANRRTVEYRTSNPPPADRCRRMDSLRSVY